MQKIFVERIEKFQHRLARHVLGDWRPFEATFYWSKEPLPFSEREKGERRDIREGVIWGQALEGAWFHLQAETPIEWRGKKVVAQLDFTGEGLVHAADGALIQGVSSGSVFVKDYARDIVHLLNAAEGGESIELWVQAVGSDLFGLTVNMRQMADDPVTDGPLECRANRLRLCTFDEEVWRLWLDIKVLNGLIKKLPPESVRRARLVHCLNKAIDAYQDDAHNAAKSREILAPELAKRAVPSELTAVAVGHAHIDTAWLWPVTETVRKCARTFANQVRLLERYPSYIFGASQPQLYQFVKQNWPKLYEKIKAYVKQGRWEPQGGMWVEADCNLISGESMVRQIVHGKNFFRDEFGVDVRNLWLPDVFGYAASMPQIMKKSGIDFFLTQKISWNQVNKFPHQTFKWRGIDGSEVIAHFPPEDTYNSMLLPETLVHARDSFKEKAFLDEFISLYGIGDGGGGPREENVEFGLRMADLEGAPKVRFGTAQQFFDRLSRHAKELPVWVGELYLELHRGTLTTQARVKKRNRLLENKLRDVEFFWACLDLQNYPAERLDAAWKKLLINQFHDILPGSSIHKQYKITHADYDQVFDECEKMLGEAAEKLFAADEFSLVAVNTLSAPFSGVVELPTDFNGGLSMAGRPIPVQQEGDRAVAWLDLPPLSFSTLMKAGESAPTDRPASEELLLENEEVRYTFDKSGQAIKALDKRSGRELLAAPGNVLSLYDDHPINCDAWDVDIYYETSRVAELKAHSAARIADGPVRQGLKFNYAFGGSTLEQKIYLGTKGARLDFQTKVEWREKHRMLRVSFPTTVRAEQASFDIPYGYIKRNTHRNTSWDAARFEVAGQRYADLSDNDYGVALLNDCKYGCKVLDNVIDLNLLRSPTFPDAQTDQGEHEFTYSLLPHQGDLVRSDVFAQAAMLNQPPLLFAGQKAGDVQPPVSIDGDGLWLEVVKKAEKENQLVLRIVERRGRHSVGALKFPTPPASIVETDLMEWQELRIIELTDIIPLKLAPFEIVTFKIKLT